MKHTLVGRKIIDIGLALHTAKEVCQCYEVCKGCPLFTFCSVYLRIDPCLWDDNDIPETFVVSKKGE